MYTVEEIAKPFSTDCTPDIPAILNKVSIIFYRPFSYICMSYDVSLTFFALYCPKRMQHLSKNRVVFDKNCQILWPADRVFKITRKITNQNLSIFTFYQMKILHSARFLHKFAHDINDKIKIGFFNLKAYKGYFRLIKLL